MVGWGLYGIRDTTMKLAAPYDLHIASSLGPSVLFTNHSISREGPGDESKLHVQSSGVARILDRGGGSSSHAAKGGNF